MLLLLARAHLKLERFYSSARVTSKDVLSLLGKGDIIHDNAIKPTADRALRHLFLNGCHQKLERFDSLLTANLLTRLFPALSD